MQYKLILLLAIVGLATARPHHLHHYNDAAQQAAQQSSSASSSVSQSLQSQAETTQEAAAPSVAQAATAQETSSASEAYSLKSSSPVKAQHPAEPASLGVKSIVSGAKSNIKSPAKVASEIAASPSAPLTYSSELPSENLVHAEETQVKPVVVAAAPAVAVAPIIAASVPVTSEVIKNEVFVPVQSVTSHANPVVPVVTENKVHEQAAQIAPEIIKDAVVFSEKFTQGVKTPVAAAPSVEIHKSHNLIAPASPVVAATAAVVSAPVVPGSNHHDSTVFAKTPSHHVASVVPIVTASAPINHHVVESKFAEKPIIPEVKPIEQPIVAVAATFEAPVHTNPAEQVHSQVKPIEKSVEQPVAMVHPVETPAKYSTSIEHIVPTVIETTHIVETKPIVETPIVPIPESHAAPVVPETKSFVESKPVETFESKPSSYAAHGIEIPERHHPEPVKPEIQSEVVKPIVPAAAPTIPVVDTSIVNSEIKPNIVPVSSQPIASIIHQNIK